MEISLVTLSKHPEQACHLEFSVTWINRFRFRFLSHCELGSGCLQARVQIHHLNKNGTKQLEITTTTVKEASSILLIRLKWLHYLPEAWVHGERKMEDQREKEKVSTACITSFTSLTIYQEDNLGVPNSPPKARWLLSAILKSFRREDKAQGESFLTFLSFHVSCACPSKICPLPSPMNLWSSTAHLPSQRQLNSWLLT